MIAREMIAQTVGRREFGLAERRARLLPCCVIGRARTLLLALSLAVAAAPSFAVSRPELRGLWVVRTALVSPEEIDRIVDEAAAAGLNALFVQVRGRGDVFYKSALAPRSPLLERQPRSFDPLERLLFRELFEFRVMQTDPNFGNYLFQPDGAIAFLDYGCVKRFKPEFILDLQALNRALMANDKVAFEALLKKMQVVLPGRPYDVDELWRFFCYHSAGFREDRVFTFTSEWVREAFAVMDPTKQTRINLPPDFVFLNRITFGLNSIMLRLSASLGSNSGSSRCAMPSRLSRVLPIMESSGGGRRPWSPASRAIPITSRPSCTLWMRASCATDSSSPVSRRRPLRS